MKKLLSFFVAMCLMLSAIVAQVSVWDGTNTVWTNGNGTVTNPYLIETAAQLAYLAVYVNNGTAANYGIVGENTYWKLTTNIDLNSLSWTPIGGNVEYHFGGHFDGDEHTVANLATDGDFSKAGVFGSMKGGSIKDIGVVGTSSISSSRGLDAGAIVGYALNNATISNCYNTSDLVDERLNHAGGIVGWGSELTISNCYNTGNISAGYNSYVGGIIGHAGVSTTINNCYNTGNISASGATPNAAGIVAYNGSFLTVNNCYNTGNVSSPWLAAGIAGSGEATNNCYNTGTIYSPYSNYTYAIGYYPVNNCYYLEGSAPEAGAGCGVSKSAAEMKAQAFVDLLNSGPIPNNAYTRDLVPVNNGFPILKWQAGEVGIMENVLSNISVYPNPTRGQLIIATEQVPLSNYNIYSITGQVMMQGKLYGEITTINVESLPMGIYFLRVAEGAVRFVKQ